MVLGKRLIFLAIVKRFFPNLWFGEPNKERFWSINITEKYKK